MSCHIFRYVHTLIVKFSKRKSKLMCKRKIYLRCIKRNNKKKLKKNPKKIFIKNKVTLCVSCIFD